MVLIPSSSKRKPSDLGDSIYEIYSQILLPKSFQCIFPKVNGPKGICDGQSVNQLDGSRGICVSAGAIDSSGVTESEKRWKQSDYNSTELGETTFGVSSDRSTGGDTKEVASKTKAPKTSRSAEVSSKSGNPNLYA